MVPREEKRWVVAGTREGQVSVSVVMRGVRVGVDSAGAGARRVRVVVWVIEG